MQETLTQAQEHGMADIGEDVLVAECDYWHLQEMVEQAQNGEFSDAKLGRWLGWMQCSVVAAGIGLSLEDMKSINRRYEQEGN